MARAAYRSRQVVAALWPRVSARDMEAALRLLQPGEQHLFQSMERRDRRHGVEVMRRLAVAGVDDRDLLAAALLHDCGKGAVPVWLRIAQVLTPEVVSRLAKADGRGCRAAAYRLREHEELGAALAEEAGSSAATVRLIRGTAPPDESDRMNLLRSADDLS